MKKKILFFCLYIFVMLHMSSIRGQLVHIGLADLIYKKVVFLGESHEYVYMKKAWTKDLWDQDKIFKKFFQQVNQAYNHITLFIEMSYLTKEKTLETLKTQPSQPNQDIMDTLYDNYALMQPSQFNHITIKNIDTRNEEDCQVLNLCKAINSFVYKNKDIIKSFFLDWENYWKEATDNKIIDEATYAEIKMYETEKKLYKTIKGKFELWKKMPGFNIFENKTNYENFLSNRAKKGDALLEKICLKTGRIPGKLHIVPSTDPISDIFLDYQDYKKTGNFLQFADRLLYNNINLIEILSFLVDLYALDKILDEKAFIVVHAGASHTKKIMEYLKIIGLDVHKIFVEEPLSPIATYDIKKSFNQLLNKILPKKRKKIYK